MATCEKAFQRTNHLLFPPNPPFPLKDMIGASPTSTLFRAVNTNDLTWVSTSYVECSSTECPPMCPDRTFARVSWTPTFRGQKVDKSPRTITSILGNDASYMDIFRREYSRYHARCHCHLGSEINKLTLTWHIVFEWQARVEIVVFCWWIPLTYRTFQGQKMTIENRWPYDSRIPHLLLLLPCNCLFRFSGLKMRRSNIQMKSIISIWLIQGEVKWTYVCLCKTQQNKLHS